jgi:hypothetical protein
MIKRVVPRNERGLEPVNERIHGESSKVAGEAGGGLGLPQQ